MELPVFSPGSYLGSSHLLLAPCAAWHLPAGTGHAPPLYDPGLPHPSPNYTTVLQVQTRRAPGHRAGQKWKCPLLRAFSFQR